MRLLTPEVREPQRELYQKAKQELRKPLEEDDRKVPPWREKTERTVVCPAKVGVFSRGQPCYVRSQKTYSLDSKVAGNQNLEAYRQRHRKGGGELSGRNGSERSGGLESTKP